MGNLSDDELFSAYLDGELTATEQAAVEQLLAKNPAARQLMDELRALSATLQSLPVYKLEEDLSQQVLRIAERRMLTEPAEAEPEDESLRGPPPAWRGILRRAFRPRVLIWPAVAAAAAVLLMVTHPERLLPERKDRAQPTVASTAEAGGGESAATHSLRSAAPKAPAPAEAPARREADLAVRSAGGRADESSAERVAEKPAPSAGAAKMVARDQPEAPAATNGVEMRLEKADSAEKERMMRYAPPVAKSGEAGDREFGGAGAGMGPSGMGIMGKFPGAGSGVAGAPPAAAAPGGMAAQPGVPPGKGGEIHARTFKFAKKQDLEPAVQVLDAKAAGADAPDALLIVQCDLSPEAAGQKTFERTVERRQLARSERVPQTPDIRYVEVEATPAEIETLLADLKAQPQLSLSVIPAVESLAEGRVKDAYRGARVTSPRVAKGRVAKGAASLGAEEAKAEADGRRSRAAQQDAVQLQRAAEPMVFPLAPSGPADNAGVNAQIQGQRAVPQVGMSGQRLAAPVQIRVNALRMGDKAPAMGAAASPQFDRTGKVAAQASDAAAREPGPQAADAPQGFGRGQATPESAIPMPGTVQQARPEARKMKAGQTQAAGEAPPPPSGEDQGEHVVKRRVLFVLRVVPSAQVPGLAGKAASAAKQAEAKPPLAPAAPQPAAPAIGPPSK